MSIYSLLQVDFAGYPCVRCARSTPDSIARGSLRAFGQTHEALHQRHHVELPVLGAILEEFFKGLQDTLRSSVSFVYHKPDKFTCIYTDASDQYWSAVVKQTSEEQQKSPFEKQAHDLFPFWARRLERPSSGGALSRRKSFLSCKCLSS